MNYAIIDLGSNTTRLSIYRYEDSKITTVISQKEVAGLAGYVKDNHMELEGIQKACDVLSLFKRTAIHFVAESDIHVFTTASLRGILNREQALEAIQQVTGLCPVELSGEEEARLAFIGASHFTECTDGIMIDIGGASTELVRFKDSQHEKLVSMPIGCLNLYTKYVSHLMPNAKERKRIKKVIRQQFDSLGMKDGERLPLMIGIGGTVRAVGKLSFDLFSLPKEQSNIDAGFVKDILRKLKHNEDEIYRTVYKLIPERTLTIFTGAMILAEAVKRFGCDRIFVSGYGVREGYLIDRVLNGVGSGNA